MALANLSTIPIGPGAGISHSNPSANFITMDAANEAMIFIGHVITSDGTSHTIDTTGSSSLGWRTSTSTFVNVGTTLKVGLAAVDTAAGPPARAVNVSDVITFDVSKTLTGGSGITGSAWQTHVPDAGSKTIASGDLVAFAVQMTARGGSDSVIGAYLSGAAAQWHRPVVTSYTGAAYAVATGLPTLIITFADGALGFMLDGEVFNTIASRSFSSSLATKEYGQLFQLPVPVKIVGCYCWATPDSDFSVVLYSDPLGTPVAERTVAMDTNTLATATSRRFSVLFASPYSTIANQLIAIAYKPGVGGVTTNYKTLASASHRVADPWSTTGYGVSRGTAAFSNVNSSLEHYFIGLLAGGFEVGSAGRAVMINTDSLVA